jgi:predicted nucleic acid-binding Zn ribbon protein
MTEKYYDIDNLIPAKQQGYFFCFTHLEDRPTSEKSPDPRYCQQCYNCLLKEWQTIKIQGGRSSKPEWLPVMPQNTMPAVDSDATVLVSDATLSNDVVQLSVTKTEKYCVVCNNSFPAKRSDAKYCGDKCRQIGHRQEKQLPLMARII